jgi:hypothetical protein
VEHHPDLPDPYPVSANERLRALAASKRRDPIAAGAALRRLKAAQRSGTAERPYERARHGATDRGPRL